MNAPTTTHPTTHHVYFNNDFLPVLLSSHAVGGTPPQSLWCVRSGGELRDNRTPGMLIPPEPVYLLTPETFALVWRAAKVLEEREIAGQYPTEKMRELAERLDVLRTFAVERFGDEAVRVALNAPVTAATMRKLPAPDPDGAVDFDSLRELIPSVVMAAIADHNAVAKVKVMAGTGTGMGMGMSGEEKKAEDATADLFEEPTT